MATNSERPISPLMADIMGAMMDSTAKTQQRVQEYEHGRILRAEAMVRAIRAQVLTLTNQPSLPHPDTIEAALYPNEATIDRFRSQSVYESDLHRGEWRI